MIRLASDWKSVLSITRIANKILDMCIDRSDNIYCAVMDDGGAREELYNITDDPRELFNRMDDPECAEVYRAYKDMRDYILNSTPPAQLRWAGYGLEAHRRFVQQIVVRIGACAYNVVASYSETFGSSFS